MPYRYFVSKFPRFDEDSVDFYSGLPYFPTFRGSPFSRNSDYEWYVNQFSPIRHYRKDSLITCPDYITLQDRESHRNFRNICPLNLRFMSLKAMLTNGTFSQIENAIYENLAEGKDENLPCNYGQLRFYFNLLKDADLYLCTTNLMREIIKRDCVKAFETVLDVFGKADIGGDELTRNDYFISLLQHLLIWKSVNIKKYVLDKFEQADNNANVPLKNQLYPTRKDLVKLHHYNTLYSAKIPYIPTYHLRSNEPYVPSPSSYVQYNIGFEFAELDKTLSKQLFVVHCPFQRYRWDKKYFFNCHVYQKNRWYDFSNIANLNDLSVTPIFFYSKFWNSLQPKC